MKKELFYLSNLISMSRFLILGITVYYLVNDNFLFSCFFILIIWISDLLDGYFARKRNEISKFGKIIDPLADKVSVILIVLVLLTKQLIPLWYVIIIISRDALILAGGLYLTLKKNIVLQSNFTGKAAVFTIGAVLFTAIAAAGAKIGQFGNFIGYHNEITELLYTVLLFISLVMVVISLVSYFYRFKEFK